MEFKKYPSLENHYREIFVHQVQMVAEPDHKFVVTEKVHGANFQFTTDGTTVKVGSRSQYVDGQFYNCQSVVDLYQDKVKKLCSIIEQYFLYSLDVKSITLYGELYGGLWFGSKYNQAKTIQKGVYYCPHNDFIGFDIRVELEDDASFFLSYEEFQRIMDKAKLPYVRPLLIGSLQECLNYPNDGNSTIPGIMFNLDSGDKVNTMEGVVIKSYTDDLYTHRGSRAVIKSKNEKWSEKQNKNVQLNPRVFTHPLQETIMQYINENRLDAVLSKLGGRDSLTQKDFGRLIGLLSSDVFEDLIKDGVLSTDWKKDESLLPLGKWVSQQVKEFLIPAFLHKV